LSKCNEEYHICVKRESDRIDEDKPITSVGSIQIEYVSQGGQKDQVSKVSNSTNNVSQQCVSNEVPASSSPLSNNVFNVQLNYNINQALDPEKWDGNFYVISLHGSMEHLALNIKNIKDSLHRMGKYIKGKAINDNNPNDVKNLYSIGKAI